MFFDKIFFTIETIPDTATIGGDLDADEFRLMYRAENSHWWYRGMEGISRAVLSRYYRTPSALRILDAGCGTGGNYRWLSEFGRCWAMDLSPIAMDFCRQRGIDSLIRGSVVQLPFSSDRFDLVTSFDVLSMLSPEQEASSLAELARILVPGGRLFLRLPAYRWLRGAHDRAVSISHRYHRKELQQKLESHGLACDWIGYTNMFLCPAVILKRWSEHFRAEQPQSDLSLDSQRGHRLFCSLLNLEARLLIYRPLPFGLTLMAVARKHKGRNQTVISTERRSRKNNTES